jgi:vacuolar-type H+-ATPase subunit D/Vma8
VSKGSKELQAEIRRITEDTRKLRREMEEMLHERMRPSRAFSHGQSPSPVAKASDVPPRKRRR